MIKISRYRPAFFTGFPEEEALVDTLEELLAIPWVHSWTQDKDFHRLSIDDNRYLMAEFNEGSHWHVIAIIDTDDNVFGLPEWKPKK